MHKFGKTQHHQMRVWELARLWHRRSRSRSRVEIGWPQSLKMPMDSEPLSTIVPQALGCHDTGCCWSKLHRQKKVLSWTFATCSVPMRQTGNVPADDKRSCWVIKYSIIYQLPQIALDLHNVSITTDIIGSSMTKQQQLIRSRNAPRSVHSHRTSHPWVTTPCIQPLVGNAAGMLTLMAMFWPGHWRH